MQCDPLPGSSSRPRPCQARTNPEIPCNTRLKAKTYMYVNTSASYGTARSLFETSPAAPLDNGPIARVPQQPRFFSAARVLLHSRSRRPGHDREWRRPGRSRWFQRRRRERQAYALRSVQRPCDCRVIPGIASRKHPPRHKLMPCFRRGFPGSLPCSEHGQLPSLGCGVCKVERSPLSRQLSRPRNPRSTIRVRSCAPLVCGRGERN